MVTIGIWFYADPIGLKRTLDSVRVHTSGPYTLVVLGDGLQAYGAVRHRAGHLWTTLKGLDVTDYFARRPAYRKALVDCLSSEDQEFYRRLKRIAPGIVAEETSL